MTQYTYTVVPLLDEGEEDITFPTHEDAARHLADAMEQMCVEIPALHDGEEVTLDDIADALADYAIVALPA